MTVFNKVFNSTDKRKAAIMPLPLNRRSGNERLFYQCIGCSSFPAYQSVTQRVGCQKVKQFQKFERGRSETAILFYGSELFPMG